MVEIPDRLRQVLEKAKQERLTTLNLSGYKLTELPSTLGNFTKLTTLDLSRNLFKQLPESLGYLPNLTTLDLSSNLLTELPSTLGYLTNLTKLYLYDNQITKLADTLKYLKKLKDLSISINNPIDLSVLLNIKGLDVRVNGLYLERKYWQPPQQWRSHWILEESNAEIRRLLIELIGYSKICQDLEAKRLHTWREYSLVKIPLTRKNEEDIYLLTMKCPSTGYLHALRVPPDIRSAKDAITWVNWGISPDEFELET